MYHAAASRAVELATGFAQILRCCCCSHCQTAAVAAQPHSAAHSAAFPRLCFSAQPSPAAFFLESLLRSSGPCSSGAPAPPAPDSLPDGDSAITAPALGLSLAQPAAILSCGKQQHSGGSHARESGDILPLPLPPPAPQNSRCWQGGGGGGPTRTPHTGGQSHAGGGDLGDGSRPKTCGQPLTNGKGVRANFLDPFLQPHPHHFIPPLPCCSPTPG